MKKQSPIIPKFLQEKLKQKITYPSKYPDEIKQFMLNYSVFYNWGVDDLTIIVKLMRKNIKELPNCEYINCNNKKTFNFNTKNITAGCCANHTRKISNLKKYGVEAPIQSDKIRNQIKQTNLKKYGNEWNIASDISRNKQKETCIKKYGESNPMLNSEIKQKAHSNLKLAILSKYGVSNVFANPEIRNQRTESLKSKYGVEHPIHDMEIRTKIEKTNLIKYGSEFPFQTRNFINKTKITNLRKYGVEYPMQNPTVLAKNQKSSFKRKEYIWKSGEISIVQGYEPIVLKELEEQGYKFNEVLTSPKDMPEITYKLGEKEHRYFPDIFIPKDNIIIEVKSEWSLKLQIDKNQAKFQAVRNLGFNFKLEVR